RRIDGRKMTTCDPYLATLEEEYWCPNEGGPGCGWFFHVATGSTTGSTSSNACANARAMMCEAVDPPASCQYQFCSVITNQVGENVGQQGSVCIYGNFPSCTNVDFICR